MMILYIRIEKPLIQTIYIIRIIVYSKLTHSFTGSCLIIFLPVIDESSSESES